MQYASKVTEHFLATLLSHRGLLRHFKNKVSVCVCVNVARSLQFFLGYDTKMSWTNCHPFLLSWLVLQAKCSSRSQGPYISRK